MTIRADGLSVKRLGRAVLHGVSIRIDPGECVSVIGPNGAGKSTLMAALLDLVPASDGDVQLNGEPIRKLSRRRIARQIAFVPQLHEGYLGFRVRDVVESGRYAYVDPLSPLSQEDHSAVDAAVDACRISQLLERTVDTLSGGERQKVWIAAALAQQTPVLFLDEPTNALDPAHEIDLIRIMRRFAEAGNTLLVICHDLNLPLALGGRVIALKQGRVFFDEPVEFLHQTARLADLFDTPFVLHRQIDGDALSVQLRL